MFSIKYSDAKLTLPLEKIEYCVQDLVFKYYTELLYGYEFGRSLKYIIVSPVVELSDDMMELLQCNVDIFNTGLAIKSKLLPQMKLVNQK